MKNKKNVNKNVTINEVINNAENGTAIGNVENMTVINNKYILSVPQRSIEDVNNNLGIFNNTLWNNFISIMQFASEEAYNKCFEQIHPAFMAIFLERKYINEQADMLLDIDFNESIRKQAIQKIGILTKADISLLKIVHEIYELSPFISLNALDDIHQRLFPNGTNDFTNLIMVSTYIENTVRKIEAQIQEHFKLYGEIKYESFENLIANQLIRNDGNTHRPLVSLFLLLSAEWADNKTRNEEYYSDPDRLTKNRAEWQKWFDRSNYTKAPNVLKIADEINEMVQKLPHVSYYEDNDNGGKLFWSLSSVGEYIAKK